MQGWLKLETPMTTYAGKDRETVENSSTDGESANFYSYFGDQYDREMGVILPQDLAIALLGTYQNDQHPCNKDMCSTMSVAALFELARYWKQPRCPSSEEGKKKMWHIYTMEYYSAGEEKMES